MSNILALRLPDGQLGAGLNSVTAGQECAANGTKDRLGLQVYTVETDSEAQDQVDALPVDVLKRYAELMAECSVDSDALSKI